MVPRGSDAGGFALGHADRGTSVRRRSQPSRSSSRVESKPLMLGLVYWLLLDLIREASPSKSRATR